MLNIFCAATRFSCATVQLPWPPENRPLRGLSTRRALGYILSRPKLKKSAAKTHTATLNTVPMTTELAPGTFVRHPIEVRWGLGQVQSVVGDRVTVSFENRGKVVINSAIISLITTADDAMAGTRRD